MDAQVSYEFHSERKRNPEKFKNQLTNQVYLKTIFFFISLMVYSDLQATSAWVYNGSYNAFLRCRVHMLSLDLNKDGLLLL